MYREIEIIATDYKDKYLLKHGEKTLFVGFIVKDIIEFLKEGKTATEICQALKNRHIIDLSPETIHEIIENKINVFIEKKHISSFQKVFKLFNPSIIKLPQFMMAIFEPWIFYPSFIILSLINAFIYINQNHVSTSSTSESIITYALLFFILILHELGHTLSARKYNVHVKEIGLGLYYILPVLYVDLNEAWKLDKKKRVLINLAGTYFQLISGVLLFLSTILFESYTNIFMGLFFINLSIVALNINPFLKFDGYWITSDLINQNNLIATSNEVIKNMLKFKRLNQSPVIVIYSFLKLIFIFWIMTLLFRFFYFGISNFIEADHIGFYNSLPLILLCYLVYRQSINFFRRT
jgi:putative peptide zinc metalloprotease protein